MSNDKSAVVMMEEGYMSLRIDYKNSNDRTVICDAIHDAETKLDLYPDVFHKRNKEGGYFIVDFPKEEYLHSREPGKFVDIVLKDLNIEHCENR